MPQVKIPAVSKSDFFLSPFHDTLMLRHLSHWNGRHWHVLTERKADAERGAPGSRWEPHVTMDNIVHVLYYPWCYQEIGVGGAPNLMGVSKFYDTGWNRTNWTGGYSPAKAWQTIYQVADLRLFSRHCHSVHFSSPSVLNRSIYRGYLWQN